MLTIPSLRLGFSNRLYRWSATNFRRYCDPEELTGALNISLSEYAAVPATSLPALALRAKMSLIVTFSLGFCAGMGSASGSFAAVPSTSYCLLLELCSARCATHSVLDDDTDLGARARAALRTAPLGMTLLVSGCATIMNVFGDRTSGEKEE